MALDHKFSGILAVFLVLPSKEITLARDGAVWDPLWVLDRVQMAAVTDTLDHLDK